MQSKSQKVRRRVVVARMGGPKLPIGRPRLEVPDLLVTVALGHRLKGQGWADVLAQLTRDGFVRVPRKTLIRRVDEKQRELDKQNSDPCHY